MQILFLAKKTNWCNMAKDFLERNFDKVISYQGDYGKKIPITSNEWHGDYIISFLSPWIVSEDLLNNTRKKALNFHPGTPKYGGIGCYNFAIYNEEKEYGVMCHEMEKKVDSGKIIKVKKFPIEKDETVLSLKERSMKNLLDLFYEITDLIKKGKDLPISKELWGRKPYTQKDLQNLCKITLDMSETEMLKRIRATYYPGGPDFPYIKVADKKITLKETSIDELEDPSL